MKSKLKDMEFKGKQRAEEYVNNEFFNSGENKNIDQCFKNFAKDGFLDGYNQALKDIKSKEMLEMLQWFIENFEYLFHEGTEADNKVKQAKQLIKSVEL